MTIEQMVTTYNIKLHGDDMLEARISEEDRESASEMIRANKAEILEHLKAKRIAAAERKAKIDAIEGLSELEAAYDEREFYRNAFNRMMEDEYNDGARPPKRPTSDIKALKEKFPRADAYLMAREWCYASHYAKSEAGRRAVERIINGEDYTTVIADMEAEWDNHCKEDMWD